MAASRSILTEPDDFVGLDDDMPTNGEQCTKLSGAPVIITDYIQSHQAPVQKTQHEAKKIPVDPALSVLSDDTLLLDIEKELGAIENLVREAYQRSLKQPGNLIFTTILKQLPTVSFREKAKDLLPVTPLTQGLRHG